MIYRSDFECAFWLRVVELMGQEGQVADEGQNSNSHGQMADARAREEHTMGVREAGAVRDFVREAGAVRDSVLVSNHMA